MRRRSDKYVAESLRAVGVAFIVGGLFRAEGALARLALIVGGGLLIVIGWVFAAPGEDD